MLHDFHFVLKSRMKDKIFILSKKLDLSLSAAVVFMLKTMEPMLDYYHFIREENKDEGRYQQFDAEEDMHVYMEKSDYRKLKLVFAHMYIHSMAIIIRKMIDLFIEGVKKYGFNEFIEIMEEYKEGQDGAFAYAGSWDKRVKKELSHLKEIPRFCRLTFSDDLTLISIELLKKYLK
jgi:hypothetical protein